MKQEDLIKLLLATRDGYAGEATMHRFLMDAYAGTGGFQGKVRQPLASYWGWAADVYNALALSYGSLVDDEVDVFTYLDRFHREDISKFRRRVATSHYPNYIMPSIDVPLSYLWRKKLKRKPDGNEALAAWSEDVNGSGLSWDRMLRDTCSVRAAVLGWCPVLFDLPSAGAGDGLPRTALDDQRDRLSPRAIPLFPCNVMDWQHDDAGNLMWAKIRVDYTRREGPLDPALAVTRITIWWPNRWEWYEIAGDDDGKQRIIGRDEGINPFGRVPLVTLVHKPIPDDPMRGIPKAGDASMEARRLFNLLSELDEHLRSSAFAFLQVPCEDPSKIGGIVVGSGNALPIKPDWKNEYKWVMPEGTVSEAYEKRIASTIEEIYRMQRMEFTRGSKYGQARSGVSQAFEFEATNRAIADFAANIADFDQACRRLVARVLPGAPEQSEIITSAATRFDVEEMAKELDEAQAAVSLGLGATFEAELKKRVAFSMLGAIEEDVRQQIADEIDAVAEAERQERRDFDEARRAIAEGARAEGTRSTDDDFDEDDADAIDADDEA